MQRSLEVRWFFDNRKDIVEIEQWFAENELKLDEADFDRKDIYLKLPGVSTVGVKIRDPQKSLIGNWNGKLEIKTLLKETGDLKLQDAGAGKANEWMKFSFNLPGGEDTMKAIIDHSLAGHKDYVKDASNQWMEVQKKRLLLTFDVEKKQLSKLQAFIAEGCGIELTEIFINERTVYSFGLESYSICQRQEENFFETLNYVFSHLKTPALSMERSMSYPEFISHLLSS